jgi:hypothetical protein
MIGCLILAFSLCQVPAPGYYIQPAPVPAYNQQVVGYPVPVQPVYTQQVYGPPYYPAYPPVSVAFRFGGWGGHGWGYGGGHWHR